MPTTIQTLLYTLSLVNKYYFKLLVYASRNILLNVPGGVNPVPGLRGGRYQM